MVEMSIFVSLIFSSIAMENFLKSYLFKIVLVATLFLYGNLFPALAQDITEGWVNDNYSKKEYMIPMRDGVRLFTSVYMPNDRSENHPLLITRTPYSCAPYGEEMMNPNLWKSYLREYMKEGYIMVFQDVRGKWMSEGEFVDVRPFIQNKQKKCDIDEASDAYDTVEWLIGNIKGNNGNVGFYGSSYPGFYTTMAAASNHPAIKAVSPQAPVFDWFMGDDFHHNGAFMLSDAAGFFSRHGLPRPEPTTKGAKRVSYLKGDLYSSYLDIGTIKNLTCLLGDSIRFWNDMLLHPDYDEWWQERCAVNACKNINAAVLVVGGLFDAEDLYGTWQTYKRMKEYNAGTDIRLVIGPWAHSGWRGKDGSFLGDIQFGKKTAEYYQYHLELPFFNYYLKEKSEGLDVPEVSVFFTGENEWRFYDRWPLTDYVPTAIYLSKGGMLTFDKSEISGTYTGYISDPKNPVPFMAGELKSRPKEYMISDQRFAAKRSDVISFETEALTEDITLGGPVIADLMVAISSTDADFVVKLIDVFPDSLENDGIYTDAKMKGYQMLVRGDMIRGKYRSSFEKPEAFMPWQPTPVKFELPDIAHVFKKGHRIMIQIQSSWFPLVDRNPQQFTNIYKCDEEDFVRAEIRILHDGINASKIILPVLK